MILLQIIVCVLYSLSICIYIHVTSWFLSTRHLLIRMLRNDLCHGCHMCRVRGDPLIEIEFDNKESLQLQPSTMTVNDIVSLLKNRADEMDMNTRLKAAGLANHTFAGDAVTGRDFVGTGHKIPRQ